MRDSDEEEKEELVAKCPTLRRIDYHNLQGHRTVTRYQHRTRWYTKLQASAVGALKTEKTKTKAKMKTRSVLCYELYFAF